eukprot:NODE_6097_length_344_cov_138.972881_g4949_i0.p1 GENE.NODE_6097_length_344_cov_138.972881_g4949_i0~~NODE_6097_length_344_cov_138.972881_g4949_i0.p1  ORF type:complete len:96 (+),score=44.91 NODE_6097_length_344_cov_138.972881_g4949_i0:30-290(+)
MGPNNKQIKTSKEKIVSDMANRQTCPPDPPFPPSPSTPPFFFFFFEFLGSLFVFSSALFTHTHTQSTHHFATLCPSVYHYHTHLEF